MAFRLDGNIVMFRFPEYGIHKRRQKLNKKLKEGDRVYCIINSSIEGEITKKLCYKGLYLYALKVVDEKSFIKHFGLGSTNVVFLHWQLRKQ